MTLYDYPIKFNNEPIFHPGTWNEESEVIEQVNQTEAGTDQVSVTRYDKLTITAGFQCTSRWVKKFKAYSKMDSINVSIYDFVQEAYATHEMRIRELKIDLVENSRYTPGTIGLWNVSFKLNEF